MFVFEDIVMIDDRSVQRVLREVESQDLALALKVPATKLLRRYSRICHKELAKCYEKISNLWDLLDYVM